jgi:hypothetical protein
VTEVRHYRSGQSENTTERVDYYYDNNNLPLSSTFAQQNLKGRLAGGMFGCGVGDTYGSYYPTRTGQPSSGRYMGSSRRTSPHYHLLAGHAPGYIVAVEGVIRIAGVCTARHLPLFELGRMGMLFRAFGSERPRWDRHDEDQT